MGAARFVQIQAWHELDDARTADEAASPTTVLTGRITLCGRIPDAGAPVAAEYPGGDEESCENCLLIARGRELRTDAAEGVSSGDDPAEGAENDAPAEPAKTTAKAPK